MATERAGFLDEPSGGRGEEVDAKLASIPYHNHFLAKYGRNVFSQHGEDGVLEEILRRLGITEGSACEFGAWDGKHLSNTFRLVRDEGFRAVYIEGDAARYRDLETTAASHPRIQPVHAFVSHVPGDANSLDSILQRANFPHGFDLLSVDIDSFDYHVWDSLSAFRPKIVVIEINSHVSPFDPNHIHAPGKYEGTGFRPMYELGERKGYKFVLHTGNMVFVREDLWPKLGIEDYTHPLQNFRRVLATWASPEAQGTWAYFGGVDIGGHDVLRVHSHPRTDVMALRKACDRLSDVVAFNSFGYLKHTLPPVSDWKRVLSASGIYVRRAAMDAAGITRAEVEKHFGQ